MVSFLGAAVPRCVVIMAMLIGTSDPAVAQIRGFGDVGSRTFTARESFETILGTASGVVFGGGVEAALPFDLFVNVRASQFKKEGERVFLFQGERFGLGIPTTITVRPIELTGGYRFDHGQRIIPYGAAASASIATRKRRSSPMTPRT